MTYDVTTLKAQIKDLEQELDKLKKALESADLPDQPSFVEGKRNFITFQKRFSKTSRWISTYAAVGVTRDHWFITGRRGSDPTQGMTWEELTNFMVEDENDVTRQLVIESYRELH